MGKEVSVKAEKLFDKVVEFISHGSLSPFCLRCHYKTRKCIILAKIKKEVDKICNRQRSMCMFSACCNFYIFLRYSDGDMPFIFLNFREMFVFPVEEKVYEKYYEKQLVQQALEEILKKNELIFSTYCDIK